MENNDSVCYINTVNKVEEIQGADKIELATVNGWKSIVAKGQVKEGDKVLCITTDAVIPQEFGETHGILNYLKKGNRVRTVKLKGVYSECILIPVSVLFSGLNTVKAGTDMMDTFSIYKYQEPEKTVTLPGGRQVRQKDNPNFNKYYKFPNFKNVPHIFTEEDEVVVTRKIHGSNARFGIVRKSSFSLWHKIKKFFNLTDKWDDYEYVYGSHNVIKGSDTNGFYSTDIWREVADKYNIKEKLWNWVKLCDINIGSGLIIYGEVYGAGVQGEKYNYNLKDRDLVLFDAQLNGEYLNRDYFVYLSSGLKIPYTESLYAGKFSKEIIDSLVLNQFIPNTKIPHEGVVVAHISGDRHKICKFINPDYLIFSEKHLVPENH